MTNEFISINFVKTGPWGKYLPDHPSCPGTLMSTQRLRPEYTLKLGLLCFVLTLPFLKGSKIAFSGPICLISIQEMPML